MSWLHKLFRVPDPIKTDWLTVAIREHTKERWGYITEQVNTAKPSNLKLAIIEADKLIDEALKVLYPGKEQMAERMKLAKTSFQDRQDYDDLWYAHKVRNVIVHESSYDMPISEAVSVIEKYHKALSILGAL